MSKLPDQIRSRLQMTAEQQRKLITVLLSLALTVVLPTVVLWIIFRAYFLGLFLGVVGVNLIARYGKPFVTFVKKVLERRNQAKVNAIDRKHQAMVHYVTPSAFTLQHSDLLRRELADTTYIDDRQHWAVIPLLFFNPFALREDDPPKGWFFRTVYLAVRMAVPVVTIAWLLGWIIITVPAITSTIAGYLPTKIAKSIARYLPTFGQPFVVITVVMVLWTAWWLWRTVRRYNRSRFTVTALHYAVTDCRTPFENEDKRQGPTSELQSASVRRTVPGRLLGYGHLTIRSWQDPEPIPQRLFVAHPERVATVLSTLADQNAQRRLTPMKQG